ncbi:MAG: HAD family hydrolase [Fimbriimonadaceae bacterium]
MLEVKAVCFDLGGVLIRIHHDWAGALRAAGLPVSADRDYGRLGGFAEFDLYQGGEIGTEEYLAALAKFLQVTDTAKAMRAHMAILRDEYPGVAGLIEDLTARGVVCGCLSNTSSAHWETFFDGQWYSFGPMLTVRIGSHIERLSKPMPEIYRAFESAAGAAGGEVAYFDDGELNVAAASALGWRAWRIDPHGDPASDMRSALGL